MWLSESGSWYVLELVLVLTIRGAGYHDCLLISHDHYQFDCDNVVQDIAGTCTIAVVVCMPS